MKTRWSIDTINKKPRDWVNNKRKELEKKTGVTWTHCCSHGKVIFDPTWTMNTQPVQNEDIARIITDGVRKGIRNGTRFITVHNKTNIPLETILGTAKWMAKTEQIQIIVNRMGKAIGFWIR